MMDFLEESICPTRSVKNNVDVAAFVLRDMEKKKAGC